jgi:hypothetical protein
MVTERLRGIGSAEHASNGLERSGGWPNPHANRPCLRKRKIKVNRSNAQGVIAGGSPQGLRIPGQRRPHGLIGSPAAALASALDNGTRWVTLAIRVISTCILPNFVVSLLLINCLGLLVLL